jgi:transposase
MSKRPRRNQSAAFKTKVALAAIRGGRTLGERAEPVGDRAYQIAHWKRQLLEGAAGAFDEAKAAVGPFDRISSFVIPQLQT